MPIEDPTKRLSSTHKDELPTGYTIKRIQEFTPRASIPIRELKPNYDKLADRGENLEKITPVGEKDLRIKMETMALASMFIPEVWKKITDWIAEHPEELAKSFKETGGLSPKKIEEVTNKLKHADGQEAVKILNEHTANIFTGITRGWKSQQTKKSLEPEPADPNEIKMWKAYKRYEDVLSFGMSMVKKQTEEESATSTSDHILGGFSTARGIIWKSFGILPEVYKLNNNGQNPTKAELANLIRGTKPFVLAMAHSDVPTLNAIQVKLGESENMASFAEDFEPKKFWISKKNNNLYLEIKPEILDKVENFIKHNLNKEDFRTGCPALSAEGVDGQNVVNEMYDWFAKLYVDLYIKNQDQFK